MTGPPDHSNAPDHITEREDGTVAVGKSQLDKCKEQANCDNQMDRIESKLDLLLDEMGIDW